MWRRKRHRNDAHSSPTTRSTIDFCFENPLDGALWQSDAVALLESRNADGRTVVRRCDTSYCRYGVPYRKRTGLFTSLTGLQLPAPCSARRPCAIFAQQGRHAEQAAGQPAYILNHVPIALTTAVLDEWVRVARSSHFLLIDVFSGFGSVARAAEAYQKAPICVVTNDLYRATVNFDGGDRHTLEFLLSMGLQELRQQEPALRRDDVSILYWLSTPCQTYGPQGRGHHRPKQGPCTPLARAHDAMNITLARYLYCEL